MATDTSQAISQPTSSVYSYRPLEGLDSIRMIKLLSRRLEDEIEITIHDRTLSDLPTCSAVSYEWGSSTREHIVYCERKTIPVTANLFALLKRFRDVQENGFLWIDAICINQKNSEERSQQVSLMGDIYRSAKIVLIWLGEENENTAGAFQIMETMASDCHLKYPEIQFKSGYGFRGQFKTPSQISHGHTLQDLTKERSWSDLINIRCYSTYLSRLWIVQEIMLSTNSAALCGSQRTSWDVLVNVGKLLWQCEFLLPSVHERMVLRRILVIGKMKKQEVGLTLWALISAFGMNGHVTDPRDRVLGLLGMLNDSTERSALKADYKKTTDKVYTEATAAIVEHEQNLEFWENLNITPGSREGRLPSWVPPYGLPNLGVSVKINPHATLPLREPRANDSTR